MKTRLVSVIIPAYNVEQYIKDCIESVINQSYSNLEIILVDDGSTDKTSIICDDAANADPRVKVIHKRNGGLSDARNAAIGIAAGDYLTFIDGDDYIKVDTIEYLVRNLEHFDADISTCSYENVYKDIASAKADYPGGKEYCFSTHDALEHLLYQKRCTNSAWGKLYKRNLFKDIRYPKGFLCEDLATTYLLFAKAKRVVIGTAKKYLYVQRHDSIINASFNIKRMDGLKFAIEEQKYIEANFPKLKKGAINREFMEAIFILQKLSTSLTQFTEQSNRIRQIIRNYRGVVLLDNKSATSARIYAALAYFGVKPLTWLFHLRKEHHG